jgi:hypothetical protein
MILGIIYESISNTPVGYALSCTSEAFAITLYSTDGYRHNMSNYKTRKIRPCGLHELLDRGICMRYESE